jgi:general secretion pathway protein D/MSHA biogenesis protein MshL
MPKGFSMKLQTPVVQFSCLLVLLFFLTSCVPNKAEPEVNLPEAPPAPVEKAEAPNQLPVQYQRPSYMVDSGSKERLDEVVDDVAIKVGASIRSTQGPQPLWDILKRLAALKKMSVSWASDVDQYVLVDVDINANDDFYAAIDNLLRQVDYYHEMNGSTIVVKYKETRQFHIAMPYTKQLYETATGGNVLGSNDASSNIEGTIRLDSRGNEFDIWKNIKLNLDTIMDKWSYRRESADVEKGTTSTGASEERNNENLSTNKETGHLKKTAGLGYYIIDQHLGLISVTAPRPILKKVDEYFTALKKSIYKQVSIEAKIIEVHLSDHSSIGLNWNMLLKNLSVASGQATFGQNRLQETSNTAATLITNSLTEGISGAISLAAFSFDTFLNALKEQGQTTILSNPKLSVLNGQPSLITVGRNVTYIDSIDSDVNNDTGTISYTVNTERVLSGVGLALTANILDDNEIILNLVPVTSELQEPIEYRQVGLGEVGLPIINVREMSTTVRVKNGEMLVIGGLISNIAEDAGTFAPGTSNIPFFKYLFGYKEKTSRKRELIILLKPQII